MILALAYSDKDVVQANRLIRWIGFLSAQQDNSMLEQRILLVPSRRASRHSQHKEICWLAAKIFGEAMCHVPDGENETGWPGAANWMFSQTLLHVEEFFQDDTCFLEPDCVPIVPEWYDRIQMEWWEAVDNTMQFMGTLVHNDHMTGNAVYGRNWRDVAPSLVTCPDKSAWDVYAAPEVIPHAHFTHLIQHVFHRHEPGWKVPTLKILDPRAVLFHQDKFGALIRLIDQERFNGACANHPLFGYENLNHQDSAMTKFYYTQNATRAVTSHGRKFSFEPLKSFGGAIPGILTLEKESEQLAMADLVNNPTTGITEISQEEWELIAKKKWVTSSNTSEISSSNNKRFHAAILPTPSKSPAVLVAEPIAAIGDTEVPGMAPIKDIDDVLKTGSVVPSQPAIPQGRRPRKPQDTIKGK